MAAQDKGLPHPLESKNIIVQTFELKSITVLFVRAKQGNDNKGLGTAIPGDLDKDDDEFDAYRKRMMLAYRFRPNPLVREYCNTSLNCPT